MDDSALQTIKITDIVSFREQLGNMAFPKGTDRLRHLRLLDIALDADNNIINLNADIMEYYNRVILPLFPQ